MEMKKRSVVAAVILTFATFGLYGIYWFVKLTNETNRLVPEEATFNGVLAVLVNICTLGLYGLYWSYKLGKKIDIIEENPRNTEIMYLVLSFLGLGLLTMAIAQNELNCTADQKIEFAAAA